MAKFMLIGTLSAMGGIFLFSWGFYGDPLFLLNETLEMFSSLEAE